MDLIVPLKHMKHEVNDDAPKHQSPRLVICETEKGEIN